MDGCIGCCFTEALLDSYVKSKGITKEDYTEYIKYQLENSGFKYRKLTVDEKRPLDEDSYYRINEQLSDGEKLPQCMKLLFPMRFLMRMNGKSIRNCGNYGN